MYGKELNMSKQWPISSSLLVAIYIYKTTYYNKIAYFFLHASAFSIFKFFVQSSLGHIVKY